MTELDRAGPIPGYYPSAWPCECGGPRRQKSAAGPGLNLQSGEQLEATTAERGESDRRRRPRRGERSEVNGVLVDVESDVYFGVHRYVPVTC